MSKKFILIIFLVVIAIFLITPSLGIFSHSNQNDMATDNNSFKDNGMKNDKNDNWYFNGNITKNVNENNTEIKISNGIGYALINKPDTSVGTWEASKDWKSPLTIELDVDELTGTPQIWVSNGTAGSINKNLTVGHVKLDVKNIGNCSVGFRLEEGESLKYKNLVVY